MSEQHNNHEKENCAPSVDTGTNPPSFLPRRRERRLHTGEYGSEQLYRARVAIPVSEPIPVISASAVVETDTVQAEKLPHARGGHSASALEGAALADTSTELPTDAIPLAEVAGAAAAQSPRLESSGESITVAAENELGSRTGGEHAQTPLAQLRSPVPQGSSGVADGASGQQAIVGFQPVSATLTAQSAVPPVVPAGVSAGVSAAVPAGVPPQQSTAGMQRSVPPRRYSQATVTATLPSQRGNLIASEWVKLRSMTSFWVAPLSVAVFTLFFMVLNISVVRIYDVSSGEFRSLLGQWVTYTAMLVVIALVIPATRLVALEFRGAGQSTFAFNPVRWRVIVAKTLLLLAYSAIAVVALTFLVVAAAGVLTGINPFSTQILLDLLFGVLGGLYVIAFAIGVTLLLRSSIWAIVIVLVFQTSPIALAFIPASLRDLAKYSLYELTHAIFSGFSVDSTQLPVPVAVTMICVWLIAIWIPGMFRLQRGDIN